MSDLISLILKDVVYVCVIGASFAVGHYLIPWLKTALAKSKVGTAVKAAQQMYWKMTGPERRRIVLEAVSPYLESLGFTEEEIRRMLEAAVKEMHIEMGTDYSGTAKGDSADDHKDGIS